METLTTPTSTFRTPPAGGRYRDRFAPLFAQIEAEEAEREAVAERVERAAERGARAALAERSPEPLLTFEQAAKLMAVTVRTVRNMIDRGELEAVAIPGTRCRRIRSHDVAALVAGSKARS